MFNPSQNRRTIPLRWVLIVPFIAQIVGAVGLVGYLSYRSGQQAVEQLTNHLLEKVSEQVSNRLDSYLHNSQEVVALNHLLVKQESLNLKNREQLRQQFWQQMIINPNLGSNIFWSEQGAMIGYRRLQSEEERDIVRKRTGESLSLKTIFLQESSQTKLGERRFYLVDSKGKPRKLIYTTVADFRQLPWYLSMKKATKQGWSNIIVGKVDGILKLAAFVPVYDVTRQFQGVFTGFISLTEISTFLQKLDFSASGQIFIIERSGDVVATSTLEIPNLKQGNQPVKRLSILNSNNKKTRDIAQRLYQQFGDFHNLKGIKQLRVVSEKQPQFVQVTPYLDPYGLDWLIVTVVPESEFMGQINANFWHTILLCGLTLLGTTVTGIGTAYWIVKPIKRLSQASQALAEGNWQPPMPENSAITELSSLTHSFNHTNQQLHASFERITIDLQKSEEKFTKVFHTSPDPIFVTNLAEGRILEVNDRLIEFSGYSREELIGHTAVELNFWHNLQQRQDFRQQLQERGSVYNLEVEQRLKSGEVRTVLLSAAIHSIQEHNCVIAIIKDISDRKQLESALKASQTQLNDILDNTFASIVSFRVFSNRDWKYDYQSIGSVDLFGYTPQEILTNKELWRSRVVPEDLETIILPLFDSFFVEESKTVQFRFRHKDGSIRWISSTYTSRRDTAADCWIVTAVSVDINDRVLVEAALRESESKFSTIFQSSPEPAWIATLAQGCCLNVNDNFIRWCKYSRETIIGQTCLELGLWDNLKDWHNFRQKLIQEGSIQDFEVVFRINAGEARTVLVSATVSHLEDQDCVIGIIKDITERKQTEEKLRQTEQWLAQFSRQAPSIIYTIVSDNEKFIRFEYISWAVEAIHEVTVEQVLADANVLLNQIHPDDRSGYDDAVMKCLQTLEQFSHQWRNITPSGQVKWLQANAQAEQRSNKTVAWHGTVVDITDIKQLEAQLQEKELFLRSIYEGVEEAIFVIDIDELGDFRIVSLNPAHQRIVGLPLEQLYGKTPEEAQIPAWEAVIQHYRDCVAAETAIVYEEAVFLNGEDTFWYTTLTPIRDIKGRIYRIIGTTLNITKLKQAERQRQQALQQINTHFENSPLAIILWDKDFQVVRWSKQAVRIFGWTMEEVQSFSWQEWKLVYEEDLEQVNQLKELLIERRISNLAIQNRNYTKDGRVIICQWYNSAIYDEKGNFLSLLSFAQDITEHKQAQLELQQQKDLRETIFNEATDALFLVDPQSLLIKDCNRRAVELFEAQSKDDLINRGGYTLQKHSFTDEEIQEIVEQMQQKGFWSREIEYITLKKHEFWGNLAAKPVQIAGERIILVRITNITEGKQAEMIIQKSETRLRLALEASKAIAWERNLLTNELFFTKTTMVFSPQKMSYDEAIACVHPDDQDKVRRANEKAIQERGSFQVEHRVISPTSSVGQWFQVSAKVITDSDNNPIRLIGMSINITDLKQIEEALKQSEERFRSAFEDAGVGMALVALDGKFLKVNGALCELLGYTQQELLLHRFQDITYSDDIKINLAGIESLLNNQLTTYQTQKRYIHSSGSIIWALVSISLIKNRKNDPLYFVVQVQDITERHELDRLKTEFITIVSHELRTPLTSIRGSLGILETGVLQEEPETTQRMLQIALKNCDRLIRLVNDILNLERLESTKIELIKESCQVNDLLTEAVESVSAIATQASITLHLTSLSAKVWANYDAIIQTLTNLLSNAIKFSPEGSKIWVTAQFINQPLSSATSNPTSRILFSIKDQGRGIPSDKLKAIFGRFQQVDVSDVRQKGGTGLGLAICKSIIQQHGERIWVESVLGEGSTFYFMLPVFKEDHDEKTNPHY